MDETALSRYFSDMTVAFSRQSPIPSWQLYGERQAFPDVLHCERITDRAAGLDWHIAPHRHPRLHQFFLIEAGEVDISVDGARMRPVPPVVFSMPRGVVHGFTFSAGTDGFVVTIPLESLPDLFDPRGPLAGALSRFGLIAAGPRVHALFEDMSREHEHRAPERVIVLKALATLLAAEVLRHIPDAETASGGRGDPRFRRFEDLAQAHFRDGWRLADYAGALGISARHLGRLCHQATGQSPNAYLDDIAMREACRLIVYTRDSIAAIAYQLGFEDPSYFSRAFRRRIGLTPGAYRSGFDSE